MIRLFVLFVAILLDGEVRGLQYEKVKDQTTRECIQEVIERVEAADDLSGIPDLKKLSGTDNCYRIRSGQYRLGILLEDECVVFVRCLSRRDLYRYFP